MNALLTYRRLTEADVPTFVTMRITQLKEEGAQSDLDLEPALPEASGRRHFRVMAGGGR